MKSQKLLFILVAIFVLKSNCQAATPSYAVHIVSKSEKVDNTHLNEKDLSRVTQMKSFVSMTAEQYGKLRGKKLNFFERLSFKASQHRINQMLKHYEYGDGPATLQKISWLIKGLLFGPLALLLGYIFLKDDDRALIKWIWFGFIGFSAIVVILLLSL